MKKSILLSTILAAALFSGPAFGQGASEGAQAVQPQRGAPEVSPGDQTITQESATQGTVQGEPQAEGKQRIQDVQQQGGMTPPPGQAPADTTAPSGQAAEDMLQRQGGGQAQDTVQQPGAQQGQGAQPQGQPPEEQTD